jgi:glycosyltransferase involved in cell wall biosynthesis
MTVPATDILHAITKMAVGGAQMNTLITCRESARRGLRSGVVSGPELPSEGNLLSLAREWGVPVTVAPHVKREIDPWSDLLALRELRRIIEGTGCRIVHTHSAKTRVLARLACSGMPDVRVVQTAHGWPFFRKQSALQSLAYRSFEKILFRRADASIVVTPRDAEKARRAGIAPSEEFLVIRSGVEFEPFRTCRGRKREARRLLGLPEGVPVVGSTMRICAQKAPDLMVDVAGEVVDRRPETVFVIIGDGPLMTAMEGWVADRNLEDSFLMLGSRPDVHRLLPGLDVFLLTSRHEGLPRALLEALAAGVPAVATDVGGVGELLDGRRNGLICPSGDTGCLAASVVRLIDSPALRHTLTEDVDRSLQPFSARTMVERLHELYTSLLEER